MELTYVDISGIIPVVAQTVDGASSEFLGRGSGDVFSLVGPWQSFHGRCPIGIMQLVLVLAVVGFAIWILETYVPMNDMVRNIIRGVLAIAAIAFLLNWAMGGARIPW